jgi:CRISPR-associated protein Cas1
MVVERLPKGRGKGTVQGGLKPFPIGDRKPPLRPKAKPKPLPRKWAHVASRIAFFYAQKRRSFSPGYRTWEALLGEEWALERSRRPPRDPINALLSFANTLLYTAVLAQIYQTHLDPRIGFLHEANYRRHSLNLDVAEVFKPVLADRLVFRLLPRGQVKPGHFMREGEGVFLSEAGRRLVVEEWEKTLQTTYRHRALKRAVSYRTTLRLELYKLEKHLIGEQPYTPYRLR